ncbi:scarecrow-like protein 6 [Salvia splendens]|uniref:scarecrow-like protein 6 n=1 Tax=Salvia splendens TaxID=180675 RepID=UPI001C26F83C|nr:scarecrow-like protein 6 [Salvia splendens]
MKGMPLPFDFEGKGALDFDFAVKNKDFLSDFCEPTSVLDSARIPSRPTSSSTLSSSLGDTAGVAAVSDTNWHQDSTTATSSNAGPPHSDLLPVPPLNLEIGTAAATANPEKFAMEDWESVLSDSAAVSPSQEQAFLRWVMGDVEDPHLSKSVQIGGGAAEFDFGSSGFGVVDQGFGGDQFGAISNYRSSSEMKPPPIFNPQLVMNQQPPFFFPQQQEQNLFGPPQAKRHNAGEEQITAHYLHQQKPKMEELGHQQQQAIVDQLFKAAELVQTGNPVLAQGILARLNHQLSPIGKAFNRAAFYCKEALQLLLHTNANANELSNSNSSPFSLVFKIGAYKSFSEISPLVQFANFTCNQAILEVLQGYDKIHIVDFDIGYGGQWASLMQELALRGGGAPSFKITALASTSAHDQLELGLTRENLIQFAAEINIAFEFEAISIDSLNSASWSLPFHVQENEAVAVNLPVGSLANHQFSVPLIMRFVKQLSPRIVVSVDRGCDRTDLPFANHIVHALQSYSNLLESLDAVNVNMDALQKIERFLLQPGIEKIVMGRLRSPEKTQHWRALFLSSGFSPVTFSNFTESQAECVIKRTPVRGFQVEKRQSSLVLCWQRKELISATAWRC